MTYYSRPIEMPATKLQGLQNFVQMIINKIEAGDTNEALLIAADLHDTLCGSANPFASITADKDNALIEELGRKHAKEISSAIARAHADGIEEGKRQQKAALVAVLGLAA